MPTARSDARVVDERRQEIGVGPLYVHDDDGDDGGEFIASRSTATYYFHAAPRRLSVDNNDTVHLALLAPAGLHMYASNVRECTV